MSYYCGKEGIKTEKEEREIGFPIPAPPPPSFLPSFFSLLSFLSLSANRSHFFR
ncbi:hypothetical protein RchiOBHm_Chr3g0481341 [Rosa chinensis]|uniref:Uncharacterized protein n=1 Tax=Rosa chinensis TaxID=74649 RepID=A0A2P6RDX4_ROSCH|nr:hypothetical protein RchiOBHm_Chr3g0481341 [Rosa chinensis]